MKADRVLGNYGYVSGTVIQAMILWELYFLIRKIGKKVKDRIENFV